MRSALVLSCLLGVACAGPAGETVGLLDYEAEVPPSFQPRSSSSQMRLAEYDVTRSDELGAEVIVYYFGPGQGGSADANILRWSSQFTTETGDPVTPRVMVVDGTAFTTTVAEFEGSYARGVGVGSAEAEPDQGLVAAIVESPSGSLFLQLVGDRAAVADARDDFLAMVSSIRSGSAGPEPQA